MEKRVYFQLPILNLLMEFFKNNSAWKSIAMLVLLLVSFLFSSSLNAQYNVRNSRPTLDRIPDYSTRFSTDLHFVELSGITAGDEADQEVELTVTTEDKDLIETIEADLVGNGRAFISYRLKENAAGTATIKVVVTDNGDIPASNTRTFHITSEALNHDLPVTPQTADPSSPTLKAYPNPAILSTRLYFSTPHDEQRLFVDMFTPSGVKIRQLFAGNTLARKWYYVNVNSADLSSGAYIIRLKGKSHVANLKLVIAR